MPDDLVSFDGDITGVIDLLRHIGYSKIVDSPQAHLRMWFRGQADKAWKLRPGVYRPTFPANTEDERLRLERHLTQDFRVESAGLLTRETNDAELYFIQQHYRMPTRLLDWTGSPLSALYFAVNGEDSKDGALFMMDAYGLAQTQGTALFQGVATSRDWFFKQSMQRIHGWDDRADFPTFILPIRPDHFDKRMTLQKSCFTFHVPNRGTLTRAENDTLRFYKIPASAKPGLRQELFVLGVDEFSIFGDLDSLSKRLRDGHGIR